MFSRLKLQWRKLRQGHPGSRFRTQFERNKRSKAGKSFLRRWSTLFVAVISLLVGFILLFIPGPGIPFLILGASLLAEQFRPIASALDWLEVQLRKMMWGGKAWWRQASIPDRGAAALVVAIPLAGVGYGVFQAVFGG